MEAVPRGDSAQGNTTESTSGAFQGGQALTFTSQVTMAPVKILSIFNNKGGVGKTTLTFHLAHALAELGKRTLLVDLDPQCNLTILSLEMEAIESMWKQEDPFIENGLDQTRNKIAPEDFASLNAKTRTIHYLLLSTAEGTGELAGLTPPANLAPNLDLLPGRLTLHMYEEKISSRWSDIYRAEPLAIRTLTRIRSLIQEYSDRHSYEIAILDTSPSLGALNKAAISTVDAFLIPCLPDVFSLYGIRNIGRSLADWNAQLKIINSLLSDEKRKHFPQHTVRFLGFTIYNAKKYSGATPWDLAQAHYNYAQQIPETIARYIPEEVCRGINQNTLQQPIGDRVIMHTHNTLPSMAHKYKCPIWRIPSRSNLAPEDKGTISGNRYSYEQTQPAYRKFAEAVLARLAAVP
jgi:cellulose biosynthesis protein BcsQ